LSFFAPHRLPDSALSFESSNELSRLYRYARSISVGAKHFPKQKRKQGTLSAISWSINFCFHSLSDPNRSRSPLRR
jgi:hypothetical protein